MQKRSGTTRALALAMAVWMAALCAAPAGAAPIGDGVTPLYDEAYYASLDYYGNLMEGSVVKSYALNGAGSITDYGVYDEVVNLTDGTEPAAGGGRTTFQFADAPDHFYFEGKTAQPFQDLPWTVSLHYTLNGVPAKAEDLAGKTGVVEILLDIVPNESASEYARYNYTLEAMALFNQDDILSLEAEGAQVQLVGNLRTVLFLALPGEEKHFTIRVGSDDFSFAGLTVLMVPATLDQLQEIAKLSQRKDELEEDYRSLSGSLDSMLDAMNAIQGGLYASANGLDQLDIARGTISEGKGQLYEDAGVLRADLSNLADVLEPVQERTQVFSQAITDSRAVLSGLTDTALTLKDQLDGLDEALRALEAGTGDVKDFMERAAALKGGMTELQKALEEVEIQSRVEIKPIDYIDVNVNINAGIGNIDATGTVEKVKQAHEAYEVMHGSNRTAAFAALLKSSQGLSDQQAAETAAALDGVLRLNEAGQELTEEQKAVLPTAQALNAKYQSIRGMDFQTFCESVLGQDKSTAKQMADLWTVYSGGARTAGAASFAQSGGVLSGALAGSALNPISGEIVLDNEPAPQEENTDPAPDTAPDTTPDTAPDAAPEPADDGAQTGGDGGVGSAAVDIIASGLDRVSSEINRSINSIGKSVSQSVNSALDDMVRNINRSLKDVNGQLDDLMDELNAQLKDVARPTAALLGELGEVCAQLDELTYLLDDAADVSAAVREFSPAIKSLLDQLDSLRTVLDTYEPTVQESLANVGTLSASAVVSLRDLEVLLSDTETLMQTSGAQLDEGTRQTLKGVSATLRQTGKALSTTQDVKKAKNALADILEDTWHEYTGDINNILLMDAQAETVSLTDARNPSPSSVQVLLRTQEIKVEEAEKTAAEPDAKETTTFWGRIAQMFRDFWSAITGIFH